MKTFSEAQIKAIVRFKPKSASETRLHALLCLAIDTGVRINEALTLKRGKVDFDNLLVTVVGKGNKERIVPISLECRRILFRLLQTHKFDLVFCTKQGRPLLYDNTRRDFHRLMERLGITGFDGSFHAFRRFFARNYVRNGGNVFYLQRMLGHTTLTMSKKYVDVDTQDLQVTHLRTSILARTRLSAA
jgi:integrase/recombinase XerD